MRLRHLPLFACLAACGTDSDSPSRPSSPEAGSDAPADRQQDTQPDGPADAPYETMQESGPDGAPDAAAEAAAEAAADADADGSTDGASESGPVIESIELLDDHRFLEGFMTYPVTPSTTSTGTLVPPTATASPAWRLAEWYTQQLLANVPPTMTGSGAQWSNAYKRVVISDGFLELAVNADAEWGGAYRQVGEPWPHLLVAQEIFEGPGLSSNTPIHRYESVTLSLEIELAYANHIYEAGYDPGLHACQFLMYVTLQNRNSSHGDFGNFIWFGLPFYDDRHATLDENIALDAGTGKYMFRMASQSFMPESLHDVPSVAVSVDLLPYMKVAVEDAIAQDILKSPDLDDYYIGGMNLGFEVPGRSVATVRVRNLSLRGARTSMP